MKDGYDSLLSDLAEAIGLSGAAAPPDGPSLVAHVRELVRDERRARDAAETLRAAGMELSRGLDQDAVLETLLDYLGWIVPYDRASVIFTEDGRRDERACRDYLGTEAGGKQDPVVEAMVQRAVAAGAVQVEGGRLCAPLSVDGKTIGAVVAETRTMEYGETHQRLVEALASHASAAIRNARLFAAVDKSERWFRTLIERSSDIILVLNDDGTIRYAGPSADAILGFAPDALIGRKLRDIAHPYDQAAFDKAFAEADANPGQTIRFHCRIANAAGVWRTLGSALRNLMDEAAVRSVVFNARDETERLRYERDREAVATIAQDLRQATDWGQMLPALLERAAEIVDADWTMILYRDPDRYAPDVVMERGEPPFDPLLETSPGMAVCEALMASCEPASAADASTVPALAPLGVSRKVSAAGAPLIAADAAIGAVIVARDRPIEEDELRALEALADMAANAVHRAALYAYNELRIHRLNALHRIDTAIAGTRESSYVMDVIAEQTIQELRVDAAAVFTLSEDGTELEEAAARGFLGKARRSKRLPIDTTIAGQVVQTGLPIKRHDVSKEGLGPDRTGFVEAEGIVGYYAMPLVAKGVMKGVLEVFHRSPLDRGEDWEGFLGTIVGQAAIAVDSADLLAGLRSANERLVRSYDATIEGWSRALELRDHETEGHTLRVTDMTLGLASSMGIPDEDLVHMRRGALLHDIGKMGIPDSILLKPEPLTDDETAVMRKHTDYAERLLSPIPFLTKARDIPYGHHEKWDGTGYPRKLKGEGIPLAARIFCIIDVWDALTHDRPYHFAWSTADALEHIVSLSGTHFDPAVVKAFTAYVKANGFA